MHKRNHFSRLKDRVWNELPIMGWYREKKWRGGDIGLLDNRDGGLQSMTE